MYGYKVDIRPEASVIFLSFYNTPTMPDIYNLSHAPLQTDKYLSYHGNQKLHPQLLHSRH